MVSKVSVVVNICCNGIFFPFFLFFFYLYDEVVRSVSTSPCLCCNPDVHILIFTSIFTLSLHVFGCISVLLFPLILHCWQPVNIHSFHMSEHLVCLSEFCHTYCTSSPAGHDTSCWVQESFVNILFGTHRLIVISRPTVSHTHSNLA